MLLYIKEKVFYNFTKREETNMVKRKTLVSILISLLLCVGLLPLKALAAPAAPAGEWTDYAAGSFASGKGTKEDPI